LYAVILPAPAWSSAPLFAAELFGMGVIIFAVGYFLSIPRLAPLVPWLVGFLIALGIALLGTQTGSSLNPARQFGPAVISGHTDKLWVFLIAPSRASSTPLTRFSETTPGAHAPTVRDTPGRTAT
jgi:glycerol uptake facilitator protein/aquaporin Z